MGIAFLAVAFVFAGLSGGVAFMTTGSLLWSFTAYALAGAAVLTAAVIAALAADQDDPLEAGTPLPLK